MVTIGVSGHRFLAEVEKIEVGIDVALTEIARAFDATTLRIISSLAEGSDRLVVRRALAQRETDLIITLPVPKENYLQEFATSESKQEFTQLLEQAQEIIYLPHAPTREQSYTVAGHYLLTRCDVLLVVWDGQDAQDTGGTGEVAAEARRRGLPLIWVHAGNRIPGTNTPTTLGKEQGSVTRENFPEEKT